MRDDPAAAAATTVVAMVDSGASRTALPLDIAHAIGVTDDELDKDAIGAIGVEGVGYDTWSSTVPIGAWVVARLAAGFQVWGPRLQLNPAFSDKDAVLLGREDFFRAFTITFGQGESPAVFHLDY